MTGRLKRLGDLLKQLAQHWLTGPDGETYAPGRGLAILLFVVGAPIPYAVLLAKQTLSLTECGVFYGGLAAACTALISLTNQTEPKAPEDPPA